MSERFVIKRDGSTAPQSMARVEGAARRALESTSEAGDRLEDVLRVVCATVDLRLGARRRWGVEEIQDIVEEALMTVGCPQTAKAFIVYRQKRIEARGASADGSVVAEYIHAAKYARLDLTTGLRETFAQTTNRVESMHLRRFETGSGDISVEITEAFDAVRKKEILPSMRSMQFAGEAIERNNARMYNCAYSLADRPRFFQETFWLLLSGSGCGFSVQRRHVARLPILAKIDRSSVGTYSVVDTIEGWADALGELVGSYMGGGFGSGSYVEFDYFKIRPLGEPLRTSGGVAPGHVPLKTMLEDVRARLDEAQGRRLKPIEVHDIACLVAIAVLAGGVRRSSLISIFSPDDHEMMAAKQSPEWWKDHPERAVANNSAAFMRDHVDEERFRAVFKMAREYGEPGFVLLADADYGYNPCGEIGLNPVCRETGETGWGFCNLVEVNGATAENADDLKRRAALASRIATLQAAYTSFGYLGAASERIARREALVGIGITGIMDNPDVCLDPSALQSAAIAAVAENARVAKLTGIRSAARVTCVKPSGTASLELGCIGSGIHPHHARRYIRRVTANPEEEAFKAFRAANPGHCEEKPNGDWAVSFPVEAPEGAAVADDLSAVELMEAAFTVFGSWVVFGTARSSSSPGLTHNVSCTISVGDDEWEVVENLAWEKRRQIGAMAFLSRTGDKDYQHAPREAVRTDEDMERWTRLARDLRPVDLSGLSSDGTPLDMMACEGAKCEIMAFPGHVRDDEGS
jgi:ribonucleoside-diphosphate reductase alpha chain